MNPYLHPTARPASAIVAQQKTGLLSPPYLVTLAQRLPPNGHGIQLSNVLYVPHWKQWKAWAGLDRRVSTSVL
jgi:hypothetical protein